MNVNCVHNQGEYLGCVAGCDIGKPTMTASRPLQTVVCSMAKCALLGPGCVQSSDFIDPTCGREYCSFFKERKGEIK